MLLLLTIALPLNVGAISAAATNQTNDNSISDNASQTTNGQNSTQIVNTSTNNTTSLNTKNISSILTSKQEYAAAGTVKTVTPVKLTISNINAVAAKLVIYVKATHKLPNYILVSGNNMTLSQFLYLLTVDIIEVNSNSNTAITLKTVKTPVLSVAETFTNGNIQKTEYINIAKNVYNYINLHGTAPIYANSSRGFIRYESVIYSFSKILG